MLLTLKCVRPVLQTACTVILLSLLLLCMPAVSDAVDLSGDSRTYLQSRETADGTKILGGYEYLDFAVQNVGDETISMHAGGWLRYDFKGEEFNEKTNDDLQYAYVSLKKKTDNAVLNLGRVMVFEGVAHERVDGIYARTDLKYNFGIAAFGGNPVEVGNPLDTPVGSSGNNSIYGGRLTHQVAGLYTIGASYLKEERNGADYRKEEGIDLWLHPIGKVDLVGRSNYNAITKDWMENTYNLVLGPFAGWRFTTEASWINYKDYFFGTTMSAFTFQPGILDPNEKVRILGENVAYNVTDKVSVTADYKTYAYSIAGDAKYYGANLKYSEASQGAGLSAHKMDGDTDQLKYWEYRAYGFKKISKFDVTVDLLDVKYTAAINGVSNAYSASLALGYDVLENLKAGVDIEYAKNPDFDKDIRTFLKLIYRFDVGTGARKGV